ncbi:mortality factor 4-like protein 1 [Amblyomma americanum]
MDLTSRFQEDEKVLCFDGPLIYEAKCLKVRFRNKKAQYFVHYIGWNKRWDEWIPESRMLKYDDINLQKKKELDEAYKGMKKKKPEPEPEEEKDLDDSSVSSEEKPQKKKATGTRVASSVASNQLSTTRAAESGGGRKRSHRDTHVEPGETFLLGEEFKVRIPDELKPWLLDDRYLVTQHKMLVQIPCSVTVDQILADYLTEKTSEANTSSHQARITERTDCFKKYFNMMLGSQLLYKFERPQYADILEERRGTPMSQIYGAIHLLRLFVRLDSMLKTVSLEKPGFQNCVAAIEDLLRYMAENSKKLFTLDGYDTATPEYIRRTSSS